MSGLRGIWMTAAVQLFGMGMDVETLPPAFRLRRSLS